MEMACDIGKEIDTDLDIHLSGQTSCRFAILRSCLVRLFPSLLFQSASSFIFAVDLPVKNMF